MSEAVVTGLNVYPIKSCQGISLQEGVVSLTGFEHDREFMLIDEQGQFISQRTKGAERLAAVQVEIGDTSLRAAILGFGEIDIPLVERDAGRAIDTMVHKREVKGRVQSDEVSDFFSDFLQRSVRLVKGRPSPIKKRYYIDGASNQVNLSDGFSFLLTSEASLLDLHRQADNELVRVPMDRFRPNIVVGGEDLPAWEEDTWKLIRVGAVLAFVARPCARCVIPSIVQQGHRAGQAGEVPVLSEFLRSRKGVDLTREPGDEKIERFFGQNLNHAMLSDQLESEVVLRVGDPVSVIQSGDSNVKLSLQEARLFNV